MAISEKLKSVAGVKTALKKAFEDAGVDMTNVAFTGYPAKVAEAVPKTKTIQSDNLYLQSSLEMTAGYLYVGLQMPIKPTKIGYNIKQKNVSTSSALSWARKIEGKRAGTDTWDVLTSSTVSISAGGSNTWSGSVDVASDYYYSQFRVYMAQRHADRGSEGAYIYVHGEVEW